jgi:hypothetical protein
MVTVDDASQSARCTKCEETLEMSREQSWHPHRRLLAIERFRLEHEDCRQFTSVRLAKINRRVVKRFRRELAIAKRRQVA